MSQMIPSLRTATPPYAGPKNSAACWTSQQITSSRHPLRTCMVRPKQIPACTATVPYSQSRSPYNKHTLYGMTGKGRQHTGLRLSQKKLQSRRSLPALLIRICEDINPHACSVFTCDPENAGAVSLVLLSLRLSPLTGACCKLHLYDRASCRLLRALCCVGQS